MKIQNYRATLVAVLVALFVLLTVVMAACQGGGVEGITNFDDLVAESLTTVGDVTVGGDLELEGELAFGSLDLGELEDLSISGDFEADDAEFGGDVVIDGTLEFNDGMFPVASASAVELVIGTETITDTVTIEHGLSTVTWAMCTLGVDPDTDAGDPVICSVSVAGDVVTVNAWQDDYAAASTESSVHWMVIGTP